MSLQLIIYLADIMSGLMYFFCILGILCIAGILVYIVDDDGVKNDYNVKGVILAAIMSLIFILIAALLPSKDAIYLMTGTSRIEEMAQTPEAAKARKALNLGLDKIITNFQESK